jgi:hypothetical protein
MGPPTLFYNENHKQEISPRIMKLDMHCLHVMHHGYVSRLAD